MVRILWVEEEAYTDLIRYTKPMIEAGYVVDIAETAKEFLDITASLKYDAYIIDLLLPQDGAFGDYKEIPGIEIIKIAINKLGIERKRIIVFTAVSNSEVHDQLHKLGIDSRHILVKKPDPIESLKEKVDEILKGA